MTASTSIVKLEGETVQVALILWMAVAPCLPEKPHFDLGIEMSDPIWVPFPLLGPLGLCQVYLLTTTTTTTTKQP